MAEVIGRANVINLEKLLALVNRQAGTKFVPCSESVALSPIYLTNAQCAMQLAAHLQHTAHTCPGMAAQEHIHIRCLV